ncbi:MAG: hypothetical protein ACE5EM_00540 [Sphingomonadales bacterium]
MNKAVLSFLCGAVIALAAPVPAHSAAGDNGDFAVEVVFSSSLQKLLPRIDRVERAQEQRFRQYRDSHGLPTRTARRFTASRFTNVKWANESLVEDVEAYGVKNLLAAMLRENLGRAAPAGYSDRIRVTLERLHVANHALSVLAGGNTYAMGTVERLDPASGAVIETHKVSAQLSPNFTSNPNYRGSDFPFSKDDRANRMGPILAEFAKASLGRLLPDKDMADPVLVLVDATF